jgi:diguanylate cyclase (GGDEF)-like protein
LFARQADPYAGADRANAVRLVALLWVLSSLLTLLFLPFDHPTAQIGAAGWAIAGVLILGGFAGALYLVRRRPEPGFNDLLLVSYLGLVQVGLLVWLAGGEGAAYQGLYLLWIGSAVGVHPPRRAIFYFGVALLAAAAPLIYGEHEVPSPAADLATDAMVWLALGLMILVLMVYVRGQRVRLRAEEERAQQLARADALTGLGNRRALNEALTAELARSVRAGTPLSIVLLDVDGFKQINDGHGHAAGDESLRQVAEATKRALRTGDRGFRWGGDEFALLLPDTDETGGRRAAERLALEITGSCVDPAGRPLTVSWGLAQAADGITAAALMDRADMALMTRKRDREVPLPD